jgi:manganese/zinc/iron transport system permease protein
MNLPTFSIALDLFPLLAATLAALVCALLGNFLVLRRLSLMGDAISHAVLPGLVIAFILSESRSSLAMFLGAAIAGVATVVLVELVKKLGRVEPGAAMGVVFSVLFALGVLLIERAAVRHVDLDADCVLHGQLETLVWFGAPERFTDLLSSSTLDAIPRQVTTLFVMLVAASVFIALFFKELRVAAFDPALATTLGFHSGAMHFALMLFVAGATVASFEAVGSILVIAMLICPAATARLLTDRLLPQIVASLLAATLASLTGYFGASWIPALFHADSVNAAGMITVASGAILVAAVFFSPSHGVLARIARRTSMRRRIAIDDLLAALFRREESGGAAPLASNPRIARIAARRALVARDPNGLSLTDAGRSAAREIVRRHRLWESYLVERAGLSPDHVHQTAERLEHLRVRPTDGPPNDPHGRPIPSPPSATPDAPR